MTSRALDEVREKPGASCSATVGSAASMILPSFGYLEGAAEVRPEGDDRYFKTASQIADDM